MKWSNITNCNENLRLNNVCWISLLWEALGLNEPHILKNHNNIWHFYFSRFLVKCLNEERGLALHRNTCVFFFCICPKERAEWWLGWHDFYEEEILISIHSCVHVCAHAQSSYLLMSKLLYIILKQKSDHVTSLLKIVQWLPISPRVKTNVITAYGPSAIWCWILPLWPSGVVLGLMHTGHKTNWLCSSLLNYAFTDDTLVGWHEPCWSIYNM